MERGSDKHSRRLDETMDAEIDAEITTPEAELSSSAPVPAGAPDGMSGEDLDVRAELAALLGKEIWPAEGGQLQEQARLVGGDEAVVSLLDPLPAGRIYLNIGEVWEDLTGQAETHRF